MYNNYPDIKEAFAYFECLLRNGQQVKQCKGPAKLFGQDATKILKQYVYCLSLMAICSELEADLAEYNATIPGFKKAKLNLKLKLLRDKYQVKKKMYERLDAIRGARNSFIHEGNYAARAGCTKSEMPSIVVEFLQACKHSKYP